MKHDQAHKEAKKAKAAQKAAEMEVASMNEMHQQIGEYLKPHMKRVEPQWVELKTYLQHQEEKVAKPKKRAEPKTRVAVPIGQRFNDKRPQPPKKPPPPHLLKKQMGQDPQSSSSTLPKRVQKQSCIGKGSKGKSALQLNPAPPLINPNCIPLPS